MTVTEPTTDTVEATETVTADAEHGETEVPVVDEVLVEEISIDGMCGVY